MLMYVLYAQTSIREKRRLKCAEGPTYWNCFLTTIRTAKLDGETYFALPSDTIFRDVMRTRRIWVPRSSVTASQRHRTWEKRHFIVDVHNSRNEIGLADRQDRTIVLYTDGHCQNIISVVLEGWRRICLHSN